MPKKKVSYIVNPILAAVCAAVVLLCAVVAVIRLCRDDWIAFIVFGIIAVVYFIVGINYYSFVSFDKDGVTLSFLGIKRRHFDWGEVAEAGVAGSKIFNQGTKKKKKVGTVYIYFSKEKLNKDKRFEMMLKFPPKDKIYLHYTADRLKGIRWFFDGKLEYYNIGDLEV